ncbi:FecCD family ABC transporter permease [Negativicoccus succinicivorans]|uniref:FecCD family ABC transporter permease n=1 Tax=Negativicoccus succinicivorans TaxID=620903 RepID=UPI0037045A9C
MMNVKAADATDKRGERFTWRWIVLITLAVILVAALIGSLAFGATPIDLSRILEILGGDRSGTSGPIIWNIRFPRNLVGALVGANLAVAGAILQAVMKNPLADPGIVGVSSGAGLAGVVMLVLFPHLTYLVTPIAFLGAMGSALFVYALAWKNGIRPLRIILAGVAVNAFLGSGISALLIFYGDRVQGALLWMVGGLSARSWPQVELLVPYTILGILIAFAGAKQLNILSLGDETARSLGMRVERVRFFMTGVAALLAAAAVSISGLIGFVGLVVPHMVRLLIGSDHRFLLPGSVLGGAAVMVLSDTLGRVAFAPIEVPVGIIMAFLGAPFFLYLLRRGE